MSDHPNKIVRTTRRASRVGSLANQGDIPQHGHDDKYMHFEGFWSDGFYKKNSYVQDQGWQCVALRDTTERAGPLKVGNPFYFFDGTIVENTVTASQLMFGIRVNVQDGGIVEGYRAYLEPGMVMTLFVVINAGQADEDWRQVGVYSDFASGWITFNTPAYLVRGLKQFDMIVHVTPVAGTPSWNSDWDYRTPNNVSVPPPTGGITHANKARDTMSISKTDDGGTDRGPELLALVPGDRVVSGTTWTIQSVSDEGTYVDIGILPETQVADGLRNFEFENVVPEPIIVPADADPLYWDNSPYSAQVTGLYSPTGVYADLVEDSRGFGVDFLAQDATLPADWFVFAK